jgi:antitoxin component YwqK of YwqJK toxin-antitoxin module
MSRPVRSIAMHFDQNGKPIRAREVRVWGRLRQSTELNEKNREHGKHVEYDLPTGQIKTEGAFVDGLREGTWKTFDRNGRVESVRHYRHGRLINGPPPAEADEP